MAEFARPHGARPWWHPTQKRYVTQEFLEMPEDDWLKVQVAAGHILKRETVAVLPEPPAPKPEARRRSRS